MDKDEIEARIAPAFSRRLMLQRLGLAAGIIYAAPVLTGLNSSHASSFSSGSFSNVPRRRPRQRASRPAIPEIIVAVPDPALIELIAAQGYQLLARDRLDVIGADIARFSLPANRTMAQARAEITQLAPAALFDPNHLYRPGEFACNSDGCMAFDAIGWSPEPLSCPGGVRIGMIDTGVNTDHAALAGVNIEQIAIAGKEQGTDKKRQASSKIHGTAIAILIAGRADSRTPGLLPRAELVAVDAFHADAGGQDGADVFDIARALDHLATARVNVINLSFAGPANLILERVVQAMLARDVALVAAAGNAGPHADPLYPAAYDGVVAVTALDRNLQPYRQAASGEHIDFAAPGVRLWTAASVRGGRFRSGTSYAAPFVAAALAALRSSDPALNAAQAVEQLARRATDLGSSGRDRTFGWGLVQAPDACAAPGRKFLPAGGQ